MNSNLLIYGSKDFAKVLVNLASQLDYDFIGFIDDFNTGEGIVGDFEFVTKNFSPKNYSIAIGIGYNNLNARNQIIQKVKSKGYSCPSLIHKTAIISNLSKIGEGSIIMAGAIVDSNAEIESFCVLWPGAIINHDSIVKTNTFISPGGIVCGFVSIGKNCFIGAGAVIVNNVQVPDNSFIKAGSLFTK